MKINDIKTFKSIILFNEMLTNNKVFKTILNGNDAILEPLFVELLANSHVSVENGNWCITKSGEDIYNNFQDRYREYLKVYDIYSCVDIEEAEFAFERFFEFDEEGWEEYKNQERFYDIRIAVANFKKIDPTLIVFMSFITENRFDCSKEGWQFDLFADNMWSEIDVIVNTAITVEQLGGSNVVENIVNQGTEIMFNLIKKELELKKIALEQAKALELANNSEMESYIIETTTEIEYCQEDLVYYEPYYEPYYYSPFWCEPLFYW